jgi:hypothetical protein
MRTIFLLLAGLSWAAISCAFEQEDVKNFSPYAGREYPTQVYFGDTHHHTANSGDAFMGGNRLSPEQAYRFALGEEVISSSGVPAKLSRPLDFLVISDHAEGLGVMYEVYNGNPALMEDELLVKWQKAMHEGGQAAADAMADIIVRQGNGTLPKPITDPATTGPVMKSVWQAYTETAEKFNQPGRFTAMIAYEWTSVPGGNNLHRNVLYRGDKEKADQMLPYNSWQSEDPEKLWEWMAEYESKTGGNLLAIPHNGNLSNGRMFEIETFEGKPLTEDYARRRQNWEGLQEMIQTKGVSETHPSLAPNDEFAGYGTAGWDYGNLSLTDSLETPEMRPTMYLREGLKRGLEQERLLGTNPFKFGFVGGTDVHNSLTAIEEDNFYGKHVVQEPGPDRWSEVSKKGLDKIRYGWIYMAAGYAAVWATENTRAALWDAMKRKEVYATSGSRMTVRFFGGWDFKETDAKTRHLARIGYAKGVPMGGDLSGSDRKSRKPPTFLVAAMKDPQFGNLDRIQIIKGWLDKDGQSHEKIYDVAWGDADHRSIDADGKLDPVGNTVDIVDATWTNSIGDPDLTTWWTDPDFNPDEPAFYYTRVLEIPTPTWQAYDQVRFGIRMTDDVPMTHQERAWSSPIWYTP